MFLEHNFVMHKKRFKYRQSCNEKDKIKNYNTIFINLLLTCFEIMITQNCFKTNF